MVVKNKISIMKKDSKEAFVLKAKSVHSDKYDYSKVEYKNSKEKVCIICPIHGEFWITPNSHIRGCGCKFCGKNSLKSTQKFIEELREIYGDKYDYSKVDYRGNKIKVCIICPEHGEFWVTPNMFLKGHGCVKCTKRGCYKLTTQMFIERSNAIHNNKYDYSKVNYINKDTKVCIICPEHGEFWQTPGNHLNGHGCPKCMSEQNRIKLMFTTNDFIKKATEIHKGRYDYSLVEYKGSHEKVQIICPIHGEFWQDAYGHLNGHGCPKCNRSKLEIDVENIYPDFEQQKKFDWLKYELPMSLDFYCDDIHFAIECQGEQHFFLNPSSCFDNVEEVMERDRLKYQQCKEHGIEIIYYFPKDYLKYDVDFYKDKFCFHTIDDLKTFFDNLKS